MWNVKTVVEVLHCHGKKKNGVQLLGYSMNHIDVEVHDFGACPWRLTGFYGFPERARRHHSWKLLTTLKDKSNLPWVCLGDFAFLKGKSKVGGSLWFIGDSYGWLPPHLGKVSEDTKVGGRETRQIVGKPELVQQVLECMRTQ